MPDDTTAISILHGLVATPSVSGQERDAAEAFVRAAQHLGLEAHIDAAGNAIARRGCETTSPIVLLGHIDTVPGEIPVRIEEGVLHGRGAVDAKGPLAAMLIAAARATLPDEISLLVIGAVGEETAHSPGARALRDALRPRACIIGEPSGWDGVTLGYKGRLLVTGTCTMPCGHSAGPHGSALDRVLDWATHERAALVQPKAGRVFDSMQCSARDTATSSDGLAEAASITLGLRLPPGSSPHQLEQEIRARASEQVSLAFEGHEAAYVTTRTDPVVRALSGAIAGAGARPRHVRKTGTADLNVVGPAWRCPIAAYGPGDSALDHTPDEHIDLDEYLRSIQILRQAVETLAHDSAPVESERSS